MIEYKNFFGKGGFRYEKIYGNFDIFYGNLENVLIFKHFYSLQS